MKSPSNVVEKLDVAGTESPTFLLSARNRNYGYSTPQPVSSSEAAASKAPS
jgi:hypothetical protein